MQVSIPTGLRYLSDFWFQFNHQKLLITDRRETFYTLIPKTTDYRGRKMIMPKLCHTLSIAEDMVEIKCVIVRLLILKQNEMGVRLYEAVLVKQGRHLPCFMAVVYKYYQVLLEDLLLSIFPIILNLTNKNFPDNFLSSHYVRLYCIICNLQQNLWT